MKKCGAANPQTADLCPLALQCCWWLHPSSLLYRGRFLSLFSDLIPLRHFMHIPIFPLNSCVCTVFPGLTFLPQDPTLMSSLLSCSSQSSSHSAAPVLLLSPTSTIAPWPFSPLCPQIGPPLLSLCPFLKVCVPTRAHGSPGHCFYQQIHKKKSKPLKEEVEGSTQLLAPKSVPKQALGTSCRMLMGLNYFVFMFLS